MLNAIENPLIQRILTFPDDSNEQWKKDLERLKNGDLTLDRHSIGENSVRAIQRALIFLGYSTTSGGAFLIDGDFGRGTNRAVAQFQFEYGLNDQIKRSELCYDCSWRDARKLISSIRDVTLDIPTLEKLLEVATAAIENKQVSCGDYEEAIFHLNAVHQNKAYTYRQNLERYGDLAKKAAERLAEEKGATIHPEWILTIIQQETGGVVRPRFEQHWLSKFNKTEPDTDLAELRYRSMSFGLGQVMGGNYPVVGAASAREMFYSPIEDQVYFVGRFLTQSKKFRTVVQKKDPTLGDFQTVAYYYNGSGYATHHYDEQIQRKFREFRALMG